MGSLHVRSDVPEASLATPPMPPSEMQKTEASFARPSFESVYRTHGRTVARWAMRLLGPKADFEDVVQDVFMVVRRRLPEFRGEAEITTWLYEITVRVAQRWRMRARWWSWVTGRGQNPGRGHAPEQPVPMPESPSDPQALLEAQERMRILYQLLDELSEAQRTTFILFEIEGLSGAQIAKITGTGINTVWVRLSRARRKFMERMRAWEERMESEG
jgi:RNA polymerase sigma-70 factor, ECF subfamily